MNSEEIKAEMLKTKIPKFISFSDKFWFKAGRFILFLGILAFIPIMIIYNQVTYPMTDTIWNIAIGWFLFLSLGIGGWMFANHQIKNAFVKKQAKRLGISVEQWNIYAKELNLMSY